MLSRHFIKWKILGGHICGNYQTICLSTTTDRRGRQGANMVSHSIRSTGYWSRSVSTAWNMWYFPKMSNKSNHQFYIWPGDVAEVGVCRGCGEKEE